jgi:LysR family transcriptional activator of nhaA
VDVARLRNLNFQHLLYFFVVAREGSVVAASRTLNISQPTLSSQIGKLERSLGRALFRRVGRGLELTEYGRVAFEWAQDLFSVGDALLDGLEQAREPDGRRFVVGIVDSFPKLLSYRLLAPLLEAEENVLLECHENKQAGLLAELALHRLDLVLSSSRVSAESRVRAYSHRLGDSPIGIFATPELAHHYREGFPDNLHQAPLLLPTRATPMRTALEQWFERRKEQPRIAGEMDDSALIKAFGSFGVGLFPAVLAESEEVCRQYGVQLLGPLPEVRERFYLITGGRRLNDPLTLLLAERARRLFEKVD